MESSVLNEKTTAIVMVLLGVVALAIPLISAGTIGLILGGVFGLLALGLLITGLVQMRESKFRGIISVIVAIICLYFAYELMFSLDFLSNFVSLIIYIVGFFLIILGVFALLSGSYFAPFSIIGLTTIIFGVLTILVGLFVKDPSILGIIIGIWLIVSGLLSLFSDKQKSVIKV